MANPHSKTNRMLGCGRLRVDIDVVILGLRIFICQDFVLMFTICLNVSIAKKNKYLFFS